MPTRANPIPDGYHAVTPYLTVTGAANLVVFMEKAFDGKEILRHTAPDGRLAHAEVRIGDSVVMIGEPGDDTAARPANLFLYVTNADATYKRAIQAGAQSQAEPADQFYGERMGGVRDPFGNIWWIATHIEDVSPEEVQRRRGRWRRRASSAGRTRARAFRSLCARDSIWVHVPPWLVLQSRLPAPVNSALVQDSRA
jgi:PhnB protein